MTIESIAHISEIVSGIVVATTLLILVFQIRQNGRRQKVEAVKEGVNDFVRGVVRMTATREGAENFLDGAHGLDELSSIDQARFHSKMLDLVAGFDQIFSLYRNGLLDEDHFLAAQRTFISILKIPGAQQWWASFKHNPPRAMVEHIDNIANDPKTEIPAAHEVIPWLMKRP
jgi:hypothetical protein